MRTKETLETEETEAHRRGRIEGQTKQEGRNTLGARIKS